MNTRIIDKLTIVLILKMIKILLLTVLAVSVTTLESSDYVKSLKQKLAYDFFESIQGAGDFDFAPNSPVEIDSPLFWKITAKCGVNGIDGGLASAKLTAKMIKGSGAINGKDIGGGYSLDIKTGDNFSITAGGLAKVVITNNSSQTVHVSCGLNSSETFESFNEVYQTISNLDARYMKN